MRELDLRIPRIAVEDVLDRLLPIVPGGVRESRVGAHFELRMRGADVPAVSEIERAVGRWPHTLSEREVSDDWRERRLADYAPDVIGGRLVVHPDWAPAARLERGDAIDIVLAETSAFGGGTHVTTRTCLEWLLETPVLGSFADLGCGTGVLAILAARLGWAPVVALDVQPESAIAASENAARNGVSIDAQVADLAVQAPPAVDGFAANVPAPVHELIAERASPPRVALISGFGPEDAEAVLAAYGRAGLSVSRRDAVGGWTVAVLERD